MTAPSSPDSIASQHKPSTAIDHGWRLSPSVSEWLFDEGYRFEFIQALRLLDQLDSSALRKVSGEPAPGHESFTLRSAVGFNFPPSEVHSVTRSTAPHSKPELVANFFSLAGSSAPLPDWVAELLMHQAQNRDTGLRDFLDIFHHRLLSLLYRVRLRHRPWLDPALITSDPSQASGPDRSRAQNRMSGYLLAFSGLGLHELRDRLPVGDQELLPYAGLLWQRPRSMIGLERILAHAFAVEVGSIQMIGVWRRLEREDWTRLGPRRGHGQRLMRSFGQNNSLGLTAILGTRAWDSQGRFDIVLSLPTFQQFQDFLPGGPLYKKLNALVRFYAGELLDCGIRLRLPASEIPAIRLGKSRLGWTTWLRTKPAKHTRSITLEPVGCSGGK
ncbi:MAG TPA: type VI secretion system baseplate subunit TssG [Edaphobacter sp.]|nr:type VI secretion system baseplate subunit TssG [Edaphobacter sp.]